MGDRRRPTTPIRASTQRGALQDADGEVAVGVLGDPEDHAGLGPVDARPLHGYQPYAHRRAAPVRRRAPTGIGSPHPLGSEEDMPAITVDDVTELQRLPASERIRDGPPRARGRDGARWLRGRGVPGPPRVRRRRPHRPRPVRPHGPDGRGGVRAGRAEGHAVASAPRLRDRHVHAGRHLRAPGLERWRRRDHQRGHPMDDRGRRDPPHRETAGAPGRQRRPVPRDPALGQSAQGREVDPSAVPGSPGERGTVARLGGRRRARPGHRGRPRAAGPAPGRPTPR